MAHDLAAHTLLRKILDNIIQHPDNPKFKKLRPANAKIAKALAFPNAGEIIRTAGFISGADGELVQGISGEEACSSCQSALAMLGPAPAPQSSNLTLSARLGGHGGAVRAVCGMSDGSLATGALDSLVRVWGAEFSSASPAVELRGGHSSEALRAQGGVLSVVETEACGLVSGGREGNICVWGPAARLTTESTLLSPQRVLQGHGAEGVTNSQVVSCLAELKQQGQEEGEGGGRGAIVSGSWDKTARVWQQPQATSSGSSEAGASDGGTAAAAGGAQQQLVDAAAKVAAVVAAAGGEGLEVGGVVLSHSFAVNGVACLSGSVVATGCGDGGVRLFNGVSGEALRACTGTGRLPIRALCAVPGYEGSTGLAAVGNDGFLRVWQEADGWAQVHRSVHCGGAGAAEGYMYAVAASTAGAATIATGGEDGVVTVWSHSLVPLQRIPFPSDIYGLSYFGGGSSRSGDLAVACGDRCAYVLTPSSSSSSAAAVTSSSSSPSSAPSGSTIVVGREEADPAVSSSFLAQVASSPSAALAACLDRGATPTVLHGPPPPDAGFGGEITPSSSQQSPPPSSTGTGGSNPTLQLTGNFDFNFPVEMSAGQRLMISWNRVDDPTTIATQFLARYGLPPDQVPDIVAFIQQASGTSSGGGQPAPAPPSSSSPPPASAVSAEAKVLMVQQVMAMGFDQAQATQALEATGWGSVEVAVAALLGD